MSIRVSESLSFRALFPGLVSIATLIAMCLFIAPQSASAQSRVIQKWDALLGPGTGYVPAGLNAMIADSSGDLYVGGATCSTPVSPPDCSEEDMQVEKYNSGGQRLWGASLASSGKNALATHLAVDSSGDLYVAGWGANAAAVDGALTYSITVIKYSASGARQWVQYYGYYQNTSLDEIEPAGLAVDAQGNAYVTAQALSYGQNSSMIVTIKYNSSGQRIWVATYDQADSGYVENQSTGIAADASSDVYVIGGVGESPHPLTLKYDTNGNLLWHQIADGYNAGWGISYSIKLDSNGYVYEGGDGYNGPSTAYALKYDPDGHLGWITAVPDPCSSTSSTDTEQHSTGIDTDLQGNVYLAGSSILAGGICNGVSYPLTLTKFDSAGNVKWVRSYTGAQGSQSDAKGVLVNAEGDVYVTGETTAAGTNPSQSFNDYITIKYDSNGNHLWQILYAGRDAGATSVPIGIAGSGGNLFVAGNTGDKNASTYWATLDYVQDAADATPSSLAFPAQKVGTNSSPQSVTLKNTYSGDLTLNNIEAAGPFSETNDCPTILVAGATCTIQVRFIATEVGAQKGSLSIYDPWAGSPDVVSLSGTATN